MRIKYILISILITLIISCTYSKKETSPKEWAIKMGVSDNVNSGKILFSLYEKTGDERYKIAIQTLRDQMRKHPRTSEGGFWHKKRYPYQMKNNNNNLI